MAATEHAKNRHDPLYAGVAKSDITIREKGVSVHDTLWAKSLVLRNSATSVVILTMDALAIGGIGDIGDDFLPELRHRIENELKIAGNHVLVTASHTHPPGRILCDPEVLLDRAFDAVSRAASSMEKVKVGSGIGYEDRISMNRNLTLTNGKHWTIRHAYPCPPEDQVAGVGPVDAEIGVLRLDGMDGRPVALVYNFACHLLFADPTGSVTANLPGIASSLIEEQLGGMAFFLQGAAGDVIDVGFKDFSRPRDIATMGLYLGFSTLSAARQIQTSDGALNVLLETIELPRRTDILTRIAALRQEQSELLKSLRFTTLDFKSFLPLYLQYALNPNFPTHPSYNYFQAEKVGDMARVATDVYLRGKMEQYLESITIMEKLAKIEDDIATFERHQAINAAVTSPTVTAEVQGIKIGDCVVVTAPLELLTEVGQNVKAASPYTHTLIAAFSNGYLHYGPPASYYDKGGYEVTECFLGPEWQVLYEAKVSEIIRSL